MPLENCASNPYTPGNINSDPGSSSPPYYGSSGSFILIPERANLLLSGTAPTISIERGQPDAGQLVLSTTAPTVEVTTNIFLSPAAAQLTLSSTAPELEMPFSGAMVKKSTDQTGANYTALTAIAWDAEVYDTDGYHDNVSNNTRLTVPSGVSYVTVGASVRLANITSSDWASLTIVKSTGGGAASSSFDGAAQENAELGSTGGSRNVVAGPVPVTAGDYFEVQLQVEADTGIDITAARSNFWIKKEG